MVGTPAHGKSSATSFPMVGFKGKGGHADCFEAKDPHCHSAMPELTSHREFESFNVGRFDGRTSKLVAPRRQALILDGTPVDDFAIFGPLQRLYCMTLSYGFPAGQLKLRASLTVCRRGEWASTAVKHR